MKELMKENLVALKEVDNKVLIMFNILRNENISSDDYDVLLFLMSAFKDNVISIELGNANDILKENLIEQFSNSKNELSNKYASIFPYFELSFNRLSIDGVNKLVNVFSQIDKQVLNDNFSEIFDILLYRILQHKGRFSADGTLPVELSRLMYGLADLKNDAKVFNPFGGFASFGVNLNQDQEYYGQEVNERTWALGTLRLMAYGKDCSNYVCDDSILNWPEGSEKFDAIISNPPFGIKLRDEFRSLKDNTRTIEQFLIEKGLQSLNDSGKMIVLLPQRFLFGNQEKGLRKFLLENDLIETIISLPGGILVNTGISTVLVVLNKNKKYADKVKFVNAQQYFYKKGPREKKLDNNRLFDHMVNDQEIDGEIKFADVEEIIFNDYSLNVSTYTFNVENELKKANSDPSQQLVKLSDILLNIGTSRSMKGEVGCVIRIKDLSNDIFSSQIDISLLEEENLDKSFNKITGKAILLSKRFNNFKPSFVESSETNAVYISSDIQAFEVKDNIDINYLIWQLGSDFVKKQVESLSEGAAIPSISIKNLLQIVIPLPSLESQQQSLYIAAKQQSDKDKIIQANLQGTIESLIKDRFEEFQWDLHDLRNSELLAVTQQVQVLSKVIKRNVDVASVIVDPRNGIDLVQYIDKLRRNSNALAQKITTIYDFGAAQEVQEEIDIIAFIRQYMQNQEILDLHALNYSLNTEAIDETMEMTAPITVKFNSQDLTKILINIVENVKRHAGFDNNVGGFNLFDIFFELTEEDKIKISFINSGPKTEVTSSIYFSREHKYGLTGNSGMGGYAIKKLANRNGAEVTIETFEDSDYTFGVNLILNREYDFVL